MNEWKLYFKATTLGGRSFTSVKSAPCSETLIHVTKGHNLSPAVGVHYSGWRTGAGKRSHGLLDHLASFPHLQAVSCPWHQSVLQQSSGVQNNNFLTSTWDLRSKYGRCVSLICFGLGKISNQNMCNLLRVSYACSCLRPPSSTIWCIENRSVWSLIVMQWNRN